MAHSLFALAVVFSFIGLVRAQCCMPDTCKNGATCMDGTGNAVCTCAVDGWNGQYCNDQFLVRNLDGRIVKSTWTVRLVFNAPSPEPQGVYNYYIYSMIHYSVPGTMIGNVSSEGPQTVYFIHNLRSGRHGFSVAVYVPQDDMLYNKSGPVFVTLPYGGPHAPTNVRVEVKSPNMVHVSWTWEAQGSEYVENFRVMYRMKTSVHYTEKYTWYNNRSTLIEGLTANTFYRFKVQVVNRYGPGPDSTIVDIFTSTNPHDTKCNLNPFQYAGACIPPTNSNLYDCKVVSGRNCQNVDAANSNTTAIIIVLVAVIVVLIVVVCFVKVHSTSAEAVNLLFSKNRVDRSSQKEKVEC
ncbi:uncharacterized protein LOC119735425 [Patiria miniata]|uniref:Fibronectin type-III domain-containing protein n=1 Tax=Patiria miniata TaxID=46514 RepID=A0A914ANP4_PATMI|nr:uncharacterized protein LOC119735425 [Patiria miniata]